MRRRASVLVIEGDASLRASIGEALGRLEMQAVLAPGLDDAFAALSAECEPDCILVDLDAGPAGALLAALHRHPAADEVPVLALGSRPAALMRAGADAVMLKPLDLAALGERIAGICDCAPMQ